MWISERTESECGKREWGLGFPEESGGVEVEVLGPGGGE